MTETKRLCAGCDRPVHNQFRERSSLMRQGIEGLPDTYISWLGTGAQVAQTEKEAAEIYASLPKGSRADQQLLIAERGGKDEEKDPLGKKDRARR